MSRQEGLVCQAAATAVLEHAVESFYGVHSLVVRPSHPSIPAIHPCIPLPAGWSELCRQITAQHDGRTLLQPEPV